MKHTKSELLIFVNTFTYRQSLQLGNLPKLLREQEPDQSEIIPSIAAWRFKEIEWQTSESQEIANWLDWCAAQAEREGLGMAAIRINPNSDDTDIWGHPEKYRMKAIKPEGLTTRCISVTLPCENAEEQNMTTQTVAGATSSADENWYVTKVTVIAGEYEKESVSLVQAKNPKEAGEVAIENEAHTELDRDGDYVVESDGSFAYKIHSISQVSEADAQVLRQHI